MTNDEILQAAKEAGLIPDSPYLMPHDNQLRAIERFAAIIEKRTIERCAQEIEWEDDVARPGSFYASEIRKLGEQ